MRLFHRTTADNAAAILVAGFRDGEGYYLTDTLWRGVWLADRSLDENEGAWGETVLVVEMPESEVREWEWIEENKGYREFLVPAAVVNRFSVVRG